MPEQLKKEEILTTPARVVLFDSMMAGMNIKESAKKAGLNYHYARQICTDKYINALVRQEQGKILAKTSQRLEITTERQLKEYDKLRRLAKKEKDYSTCKGCLDSQSRIIGAFEADNKQKQSLPDVVVIGNRDSRIIDSVTTD